MEENLALFSTCIIAKFLLRERDLPLSVLAALQ